MGEAAELVNYCLRRGGLNLSDISRWLDTPIPTVREWAINKRDPQLYKRPGILIQLRELKSLVDAAPIGELIPQRVRQQERAQFITELKHANNRVLAKDTAR